MEIKLDVHAVIEHFGGITPLYEKMHASGIEITRKAIEKWKERESIPTTSWLQIEALAELENSAEILRKTAIIKTGSLSKSVLKSSLAASTEESKNSTHKNQVTQPATSAYKTSDLTKLYQEMLRIRRFEEKAGQLYGMGLIGGFCHLYIGQEAIAVGMQQVMQDGDSIITTYRDHGLMLTAGSDPKVIYAELLGRKDGCSKGKGGSMHMFDTERHFYGGHGIVGAPVPLGTGIAFANQYRANNNVCLTYFGDGAANQGQVYEAFNMAALWKLPVLYIIENNEYAMGTSVKRSSFTTELYHRGESMGIPGWQVDGMDIFDVMQKGREALDFIRKGKGPLILEMKTYRYRGHSMSDPAKYRSKEEVDKMRENRDPLENLRKILLSDYGVLEDNLKVIEKSVREEMEAAVEFAKASPEPDLDQIFTEIL